MCSTNVHHFFIQESKQTQTNIAMYRHELNTDNLSMKQGTFQKVLNLPTSSNHFQEQIVVFTGCSSWWGAGGNSKRSFTLNFQRKVPLLLPPSVTMNICSLSHPFRNMHILQIMESKGTLRTMPGYQDPFNSAFSFQVQNHSRIFPVGNPTVGAPPTNLAHQRLQDHLFWPFQKADSGGKEEV